MQRDCVIFTFVILLYSSSLDVEKYFAAEKEFMDIITSKISQELMYCNLYIFYAIYRSKQQSFNLSSEYDNLSQICDCLIVVSEV